MNHYRSLYFLAIVGAVLALPRPAAAGDPITAKLSWTIPTTRATGAPLKPEELAKYKLRWDTKPPPLSKVINLVAPTNSYNWSASLESGRDGKVTVYFTVSAIDTDGRESAESAVVSRTFSRLDDSPPGAPIDVIFVTASCTAPAGYKCVVEPR